MNKNQLMVAWLVGGASTILLYKGLGVRVKYVIATGHWRPTVWSYLAVVLIIGGLLYIKREEARRLI